MKAVFFHKHGGPEVLEYADFPAPEPKPGEALIRLHAAALNRMDVMVRNGWQGLKIELPHILGADGAGKIVALSPPLPRGEGIGVREGALEIGELEIGVHSLVGKPVGFVLLGLFISMVGLGGLSVSRSRLKFPEYIHIELGKLAEHEGQPERAGKNEMVSGHFYLDIFFPLQKRKGSGQTESSE